MTSITALSMITMTEHTIVSVVQKGWQTVTDIERFTQLMSDFSVDYGVTDGKFNGSKVVTVRTDNPQYWYFGAEGNFHWVDTDD